MGEKSRLLLDVRRFRCPNPACGRKTFVEPLPLLVAPHAQRTRAVQDLLRIIGEVVGGEAGARLSQRLAMKCSPDTLLRLGRCATLPSSSTVRVLGVDEWGATRKVADVAVRTLERRILPGVLPSSAEPSLNQVRLGQRSRVQKDGLEPVRERDDC